MRDHRGTPLPPDDEVLLTIGDVDEVGLTLRICGDSLVPETTTKVLGTTPTRARSLGERCGPRSPPALTGMWMLSERGNAPITADDLFVRIRQAVTDDPEVWATLRERFEITLWFGVHMEAWNQHLRVAPEHVAWAARIGGGLFFDLYAHGEV